MTNNPENGHNPAFGDTETDPAPVTAVADPNEQMSRPGQMGLERPAPSSPEKTATPITEPAPAARAAGDQSVVVTKPVPAATDAVSETHFPSELTKFRQSFEEIQAEFIGEPRAAVEKAETLIDSLMSGLHDQLQRIHGNVKSETDTEQLRVAMLSYRELFDSLGGHRAA
jgi:hypothetical protein